MRSRGALLVGWIVGFCLSLASWLVFIRCVAGCTQVTRTSVLSPPLLTDLAGDYAVRWTASAGDLLATGTIVLPDALTFAALPCSSDGIGGTFDYDEASGAFTAVEKSLDGNIRLEIAGRFVGLRMEGTFDVRVVGVKCDSGVVTMEHR